MIIQLCLVVDLRFVRGIRRFNLTLIEAIQKVEFRFVLKLTLCVVFVFYLWLFCLNLGCRGKGLAFILCLQGGEHVSYFLFLELKFRVVGAMSLGLKVDVCFSNLPKKLSVVVFGSPFLFLKFLIHFSRFPKILLAGVKCIKLAIKCFFL